MYLSSFDCNIFTELVEMECNHFLTSNQTLAGKKVYLHRSFHRILG